MHHQAFLTIGRVLLQAQVAQARIETHYMINGYFLEPPKASASANASASASASASAYEFDADALAPIRQVPSWIVQGRYDVLAPASAAWALHRAWPEARLTVLPDAGHAPSEPGIAAALLTATALCKGLVVPKSIKARSRGPSSAAHAVAAHAHGHTRTRAHAHGVSHAGPTAVARRPAGPPNGPLKTPSLSGSSTASQRYAPLRVTGDAAYKRVSRLDVSPPMSAGTAATSASTSAVGRSSLRSSVLGAGIH